MKLPLVLIILALSFTKAFGQNTFSVSTAMGLNFNFTTAASLETDMTKSDAIIISVNPKSQSMGIYAQIYSFSVPVGYTAGNMDLQLQFSSASAQNNVNGLVTGPITLTTSDQRIFGINKKNQNYTFYYDLICTAPGYSTVTGHFNFTLMFTMTQP